MNMFYTDAALLFFIPSIFPFIFLGAVLFALFKTRRYSKKELSAGFNPSCAVILPCKGSSDTLAQNITSFLDLDYHNYSLTLVVESDTDAALPVIYKAIEGHKSTNVVIAGLTTQCGQKNHNLIEAVKLLPPTDILIFADSDIKLSPQWIQELIAPLQNDAITVTTGFRWLSPGTNSLGSLTHSFQNLILYSFFSISSATTNTGVWGGSMAMRFQDYHELGVPQVWGKTSVDDMSLARILKQQRKRTEFVYSAVTFTHDTLTTVPGVLNWYERQTMYLKAHQKAEWSLSMLIVFSSLLTYTLGSIGAILLLLNHSLSYSLLSSFLVFVIPIFLSALIAPLIKPIAHYPLFVLMAPVSYILTILAMARTPFTRIITWSGVKYRVRFKDGTVSSVSRKS